MFVHINFREYLRGNRKWTIQRKWQYRVHKTKKLKTKTQYVLDTTIRQKKPNKQTTPTNNVNKT